MLKPRSKQLNIGNKQTIPRSHDFSITITKLLALIRKFLNIYTFYVMFNDPNKLYSLI